MVSDHRIASQTLVEVEIEAYKMTDIAIGEGKVSIVIPCYNQGTMLREALASVEQVLNANLLEVIVVDDGSSEPETRKILGELEHTGYRVVSQPNRGLGAARNAGIRLARGEFILPLDSDNRLRDVYLNEGVLLLTENQSVGIVYSDAEYFGERSGRWDVPEFDLLSLVRTNFIDACALFRKSLWEKLGGYDEQMPWMGWEDWDFWLRVASHGGTFVHLHKIGFDYRVRTDSMVAKTIGFDCRMQGDSSNVVRTSPRLDDVVNYIFGKPELACYKLLREADEELQQLRGGIRTMQDSLSYRLGRGLLAPARLLRKLWRGFH
jgi:glycosyltransferase involved in cell wall biosynthesis